MEESAHRENLGCRMSAIAVIPARGGSQRIPRKNCRMFHGKPIIAYSIETAIASDLFERIIVSTDDKEIAEIAARYDITDIHTRKPEDAQNEVGTQEVIAKVLEDYRGYYDPEYVCGLYATAPLMLPQDLHRGLNHLRAHPNSVFALSVGSDPLRDAGQWYWGRTGAFLNRYPMQYPDAWSDPRIAKMIIPDDRVCDINVESDWQKAELVYFSLESAAK